MNKQRRLLDSLTARQYGEVVLPDASTGQGPGTLDEKLSRCKPACRQAGRVCRAPHRRSGAHFLPSRPALTEPQASVMGTNFCEHYACRGTGLIGSGKLSHYRIFIGGTGAVSRYKLSRSQKTVMVQDLYCGQMRALPNVAERSWVSGCNNHYKSV